MPHSPNPIRPVLGLPAEGIPKLGPAVGMPNLGQDQDFFKSFLEEEPQLPFFARVNQLQQPNQKRFFQDKFQQIHNQFIGMLGQQIQSGGDPNLSFTDFVNELDFNKRFRSTAPSLRGGPSPSQFAPPTNFNFGGGGRFSGNF